MYLFFFFVLDFQIVISLHYIFTLSFFHTIYYTSTKSCRGYIFTAVCLSLCVCVCQRIKFLPNGCTDLDVVFVKLLLIVLLAQTLLKLVAFC